MRGSEAPRPTRPSMPQSYGIPAELSGGRPPAWDHLSQTLAAAHNHWIATARPDGRPHAVPVWGVWQEGMFYFSTDPASRKGRDLAANPWLVVHLESGDDVVILEGVAEEESDAAVLTRFADAYEAKYQRRWSPMSCRDRVWGTSLS